MALQSILARIFRERPSQAATDDGLHNGSQPPTADEIQNWLVLKIAEQLKIEDLGDIDVRASFSDHGLGSLQAARLVGELEQWLGWRIPETLLWNYPTIAVLAPRLANGPNASDADIAVEEDEWET